MVKPPFLANHIYHIYNRGVEKRDIFMDDGDYIRFIHHLFSFNDINTPINLRRDEFKMNEVEPRSSDKYDREPLVEILAFTLMPNHYHLMVRQRVEGGIIKFMQKLGTGYTMYFNTKYDRVGPLFQGRFKAVLVEKDAHFLYLPHYIHFNPLDIMPMYGQSSHSSVEEKLKFLESYRWSSFPDYVGKRNFPSVISREFLFERFGGENGYKKEVEEWFKNESEKNMGSAEGILLDY